jgi:asparagine synthase (glutamine-hydrolysing)
MLCSQLLNREDFLTHRIYYLGKLLVQDERFRFSSLHEGAQSTFIKIFNRLVPSLSYPNNLININNSNIKDPISVGQVVDYILVFPNDFLTKVDRASMAVSLEGREPLVDHRLFEFVAQLPVEFKFDGVTSKKILKDIVYEYIPKELMDRPKTGFSLPISNWLRNDLSYLIEEYLNEKSIKDSGYMNSKYVTHLVNSFKKETNPYQTIIWRILQFQMWYKEWM